MSYSWKEFSKRRADPREVFQDKHYVPAYKSGPTAAMYPCAGRDGSCGAGCAACGAAAAGTLPPAQSFVTPVRTAGSIPPATIPTAPAPGPDVSLPDELPTPATTLPENKDLKREYVP